MSPTTSRHSSKRSSHSESFLGGKDGGTTSPSGDGEVHMKKTIGVLQGASVIIGVIVGSGIFVSPVGVLRYSGSVGASLVMWLVTGVFSMLGAIVYAELGVTIPRSGGEYIYILKAFGPLPAFVCLWITFVVIGAGSTAANSLVFAEYVMKPAFASCGLPNMPKLFIAMLGIATLIAINIYSVKWATKTAIVFTCSKILALCIIIVFGFIYLAQGSVESFQNPFEGSNYNPGMLALSFYQGFWAYAGWNYLNFLTEEMKNPARNMPISIVISLVTIITIYMLTNIAYLAVLTPNEILYGSDSVAIAVTFAERTMGKAAIIMPIFVGASVFGSMNGEVLSMSRLPFTGAKEGHMPALLAMVSYKYLTPMPSILLMFVLVICFQMIDDLMYLIELSGLAFSVIGEMAVASLIYLRVKHPEWKRPFRLHMSVPIIFAAANGLIILLTILEDPKKAMLSVALMASGIPVYWFGILWKNKPKPIREAIEQFTYTTQKLLLVVMDESVEMPLVDNDVGYEGVAQDDSDKNPILLKADKLSNGGSGPIASQNGDDEPVYKDPVA